MMQGGGGCGKRQRTLATPLTAFGAVVVMVAYSKVVSPHLLLVLVLLTVEHDLHLGKEAGLHVDGS